MIALHTHKGIPLCVYIIVLVLLCCGKDSSKPATGNNTNEDYLGIISHTPAEGEVVFSISDVCVVFSHDVDMSSVNDTTFYVLDEHNLIVNGSYSYHPPLKTIVFTPAGGFAWNGVYTAVVTTGIYNALGLHMKQGYQWSFRIAPFYDTQPPAIDTNSVHPAGDNVSYHCIISFQIIDNGHIDIGSINGTNIVISYNNGSNTLEAPCTYQYNASVKEIRCIPQSPLLEGKLYTVQVHEGLQDESGNALANPCQWSFTTEVIPPQVLSVTPCDGASNVSVGEHISIQFSEPVQQSTLSEGITVSDSYGNDVDGTIEYNPDTYVATFIPHHLEYCTPYTVSAGEAINDISGIPLQPGYSSTFTTMQEDISPEIIAITPDSPVNTDSTFQILFSESMNEASLVEHIGLRDSYGNEIPVHINYDDAIYLCTVTPDRLIGFYDYTVYITTGVTDIHGNPLIQNYEKVYATNPAPVDTVIMLYAPVDYEGGEYIDADIDELINAQVDHSLVRIVALVDYPYDGNTVIVESINKHKREIPLATAGFTGNELNTADADTVNRFINFVDAQYIPQRTILIVTDRKARPMWCAAGDATSNSAMSISNFADAVKNRGISIIVFDAPVKSTVEIAYELRKEKSNIDYYIASQGDVLSYGFDYKKLLEGVHSVLSSNPPPGAIEQALADSICSTNAYPYVYSQQNPEPDRRSLALIDCNAVTAATATMNDIVSYCESLWSSNPYVFDIARFDSGFYYPIPWYVDWIDFLNKANAGGLLIGTFNQMVCKTVMASGHGYGIGIMFPTKTPEDWYNNINPYSMDFIGDYGWDEFLQGKHFGLYADSNEPLNDDGFSAMTISSTDVTKQAIYYNYIHDPDDTDIYTVAVNQNAGTGNAATLSDEIPINNEKIKWQAVSYKYDGGVVAAAAQNGYIYTSQDGGTPWLQQAGTVAQNWSRAQTSALESAVAEVVDGTLTIAVTGIPENCELAMIISDHTGTIIRESVRSGLGGNLRCDLRIYTGVYVQYRIYLVPVNIIGWSMNTHEHYTIQLSYQKNE